MNLVLQNVSTLIGQLSIVQICDLLTKVKQNYEASMGLGAIVIFYCI